MFEILQSTHGNKVEILWVFHFCLLLTVFLHTWDTFASDYLICNLMEIYIYI